jgi:nucleoside-diphosphate-sugar epimerase
MPKLNILLTGASGFVGTHVVTALEEHTLAAISTKATEIMGVNEVYTWSQIEEIPGPFDAVIHMAGLAHDTENKNSESDYFKVNKDLTELLLDQVSRWNCKQFVYLSSVKAVVDSTSSDILNETLVSSAKGIYGRSKLAAEQSIMEHKTITNHVILRPVMIYGKGQKGNLTMLENLVRKGMIFPFKNWGNARSVLSINNLTATIQSILSKPIKSGIYFIADDNPVSTVEILQSIGKGLKTEVRLLSIPNGFIQFCLKLVPSRLKAMTDKVLGSLVVDNSKIKKELGISAMPYNTATDLPHSFKKLSNHLTPQQPKTPKR